jgi:DNA-binding transcriptional ArsR family regulator
MARYNISAVDGIARGPHPLSLADWPFGSAARRGLLATVLLHPAPSAGWSTRELEREAGVARGGLRHALDGARAWGLIARDAEGRWHRPKRESDLARPLRELLVAIGQSSHSGEHTETIAPSTTGKRARRRAAILGRLASGPAHVTELGSLTGASRATVYRELSALRATGAVAVERGVARRTA